MLSPLQLFSNSSCPSRLSLPAQILSTSRVMHSVPRATSTKLTAVTGISVQELKDVAVFKTQLGVPSLRLLLRGASEQCYLPHAGLRLQHQTRVLVASCVSQGAAQDHGSSFSHQMKNTFSHHASAFGCRWSAGEYL